MKNRVKYIFLDKGFSNILIDEPMKNHTTFKIGGPVDVMAIPKDEEELIKLVKLARKEEVPMMILGNGSNLLVKDGGIRGLVIKLNDNFSNIKVEGNKLIAQSGALLSTVSRRALKEEFKGMEFASGIPGAIGGGTTMNAGAYGGEMKDVISRVKILDTDSNIKYIEREDLELGYRTSIIKEKNYIVLEVEMEFEKGNYDEIKAIIDDLTERRTSKQPLELPSGGSTFKRPEGYYAGKLIDDSGLRGLRYKDAQISEKHCGFIVNRGEADCSQVIHLIETVQKVVKDKFGVEMEREIMLIGEE